MYIKAISNNRLYIENGEVKNGLQKIISLLVDSEKKEKKDVFGDSFVFEKVVLINKVENEEKFARTIRSNAITENIYKEMNEYFPEKEIYLMFFERVPLLVDAFILST